MKSLFFTVLIGAFMAAVYWAYDVNYQTRAAEADLRKLRHQIARERDTIKVLETEWAYLNRPERLSALSELHFDVLRLAPMRAEHFFKAGLVAMPGDPILGLSEPVDAASRTDAQKEPQQ